MKTDVIVTQPLQTPQTQIENALFLYWNMILMRAFNILIHLSYFLHCRKLFAKYRSLIIYSHAVQAYTLESWTGFSGMLLQNRRTCLTLGSLIKNRRSRLCCLLGFGGSGVKKAQVGSARRAQTQVGLVGSSYSFQPDNANAREIALEERLRERSQKMETIYDFCH